MMDKIVAGAPIEKASKALILFHGRGGTAQGILSLTRSFDLKGFYIVALQAPNNTWYPQSFMAEDKLNEPWLSQSIERIKRLIDETANWIPKNQIYFMGFSQGACLALEVSARFAERYGGVVAFSGGLIGHTLNEEKYRGQFHGTKVFIGSSDVDPHIPLIRVEESKTLMEKLGADATLKIYPGMAHTIIDDEINWVKKIIF